MKQRRPEVCRAVLAFSQQGVPNTALLEGAQAAYLHPVLREGPGGNQFLCPALLDARHLIGFYLLAVPSIDYLDVIGAQLLAVPHIDYID